jgi:hypothetical protein
MITAEELGLRFGLAMSVVVGALIAACASPVPSASPVASSTATGPPLVTPNTTSRPTATPQPSPSAPPSLHPGGMALVVANSLEQWTYPGQPAPAASEFPILTRNTYVYLVDGPRTVDGVDYWKVANERSPCCVDYGWVTTGNGTAATLEPRNPDCPDPAQPFNAAQLTAVRGFPALVCFGSTELTLIDWMTCWQPAVDSYADLAGPGWAASGIWCYTGPDSRSGEGYRVFGAAVNAVFMSKGPPGNTTARFRITGHFDDPTSRECYWTPGYFGPHPLPTASSENAVFNCRTEFVATSATEIK